MALNNSKCNRLMPLHFKGLISYGRSCYKLIFYVEGLDGLIYLGHPRLRRRVFPNCDCIMSKSSFTNRFHLWHIFVLQRGRRSSFGQSLYSSVVCFSNVRRPLRNAERRSCRTLVDAGLKRPNWDPFLMQPNTYHRVPFNIRTMLTAPTVGYRLYITYDALGIQRLFNSRRIQPAYTARIRHSDCKQTVIFIVVAQCGNHCSFSLLSKSHLQSFVS